MDTIRTDRGTLVTVPDTQGRYFVFDDERREWEEREVGSSPSNQLTDEFWSRLVQVREREWSTFREAEPVDADCAEVSVLDQALNALADQIRVADLLSADLQNRLQPICNARDAAAVKEPVKIPESSASTAVVKIWELRSLAQGIEARLAMLIARIDL